MSLDQNQAVQGAHRLGAPDTTAGFPAGASVGTRAGFAPGAAALSGGALYMTPATMSGAQPALAASGTITHNGTGVVQVAPAGNVASIVMQQGTIPGQTCLVVNNSAFTVTFHATPATGFVADGSTTAIAANRAVMLVWNHLAVSGAQVGLWFKTG